MKRFVFPVPLKLGDLSALPSFGAPMGELQGALCKLKYQIAKGDLARKVKGVSTSAAIADYKTLVGLEPANDSVTKDLVDHLQADLAHRFVVMSKTRTQRLQALLEAAGHVIRAEEIASRTFGPETKKALIGYQQEIAKTKDGHTNQKEVNKTKEGRVSEAIVSRLREDAVKVRLGSKPQVARIHRTLLRALNIAKLPNVRVDAAELKGRVVGPTTQAAIQAIQTKYGLSATGLLDAATDDRLTSLAASVPQPVAQLTHVEAVELKPLKRRARLNMSGDHVVAAQRTLAFLGFAIHEHEFITKRFGKSTREATISYQRAHSLVVSGHVDGDTLASLNREISRAHPAAATTIYPYRVRGSLRDALWKGKADTEIEVLEQILGGTGKSLAKRVTGPNGFFDIPYDPPRNKATAQIKRPFGIVVKVCDGTQRSKKLFNPTQIAWINFTDGEDKHPYRGLSVFEVRSKALNRAVPGGAVATLTDPTWISEAAQAAALLPEDVMRWVLAHRVAKYLKKTSIGPEVCFAFLAQNQPAILPGDLLNSIDNGSGIDALVDDVAQDLVFLDAALQEVSLSHAIKANLIPIAVGIQKDAILSALNELRIEFVTTKPILSGGGSLGDVLKASIPEEFHPAVAAKFLEQQSFGPEFWSELQNDAGTYGGLDAIKDLRTSFEVAHITRHMGPMITYLTKVISKADTALKSSRDLAKLSEADWKTHIKAAGGTPDDEVVAYVRTLMRDSERLFPDIALVARIQAPLLDDNSTLSKGVKAFSAHLDNKLDFDLRRDPICLGKPDLPVMKVGRLLQRIHRLAPTAAAGKALFDKGIHSAAQIVAMGKDRFVALMTKGAPEDQRTALTIYGLAEHQYAKVLHRIGEYRQELHRANPRAIVSYTYTKKDLDSYKSRDSAPDLETLFGSLDYCAVPHCESVYGPAAYLADVLRFLGKHDARLDGANKTVLQILLDRRPDLEYVELSCENTETPLPYIDLVCEVLEAAVPSPAEQDGKPTPPTMKPCGRAYQTTRTAAELRAMPEHVRSEAYEELRKADFPITPSFDLWQEQTRVYLDHLGVARWELMEAFQKKNFNDQGEIVSDNPLLPSNLSIAGEYWGMSSHEVGLVVSPCSDVAKLKRYWGIPGNGNPPIEWTVADFLRRSRLDYNGLLELLQVDWICPEGESPLGVKGLGITCSTDEQMVTGLTVAYLDRIHRFLRLSSHLPWSMWELDALLKSAAIKYKDSEGEKDKGDWLVRLQQFSQLQKRLGLSVEQALMLFSEISHETHERPTQPGRAIPTFYESLFLNPAVTAELDKAFKALIEKPAVGDQVIPPCLARQRSAICAAFGLSEADLTRIAAALKYEEDSELSLSDLAAIGARGLLAKALKLEVKDLLSLVAWAADPFASPEAMLEFTKTVEWLSKSGCTVDELRFWLGADSESPLAFRTEAVQQRLVALRNALLGAAKSGVSSESDPAKAKAAAKALREPTIISQVATLFGISIDAASLLLKNPKTDGVPDKTSVIEVLQEEKFIEALLATKDDQAKEEAIKPEGNFKNAFLVFNRLHMASLMIDRFKWPTKDLAWLLENASSFEMVSPLSLPMSNDKGSFDEWLDLTKWSHVLRLFPEPEKASLRGIFLSATKPSSDGKVLAEIKESIVALTQWTKTEVDDLVSKLALDHKTEEKFACFSHADTFLEMEKCIRYARRIGVSVKLAAAWSDRETDKLQQATAGQVRHAVKSKYDEAVWLERAAPIEDRLREKKREALVAYLMALSQWTCPAKIKDADTAIEYDNPAYWLEPNDLLRYFLIDVEMTACQLTSRIKQAISTTQMFVQRCLLGLERPGVEISADALKEKSSDNAWSQWKWMKSYRIWEANRKVFLYPENWIEPELRDDKSPFFKELEDELMQSDLDDKAAEAALLRYTQKVHEVARLDIVSTYYELHDSTQSDNGEAEDDLPPDVSRLHVIGRTKAQPAIYYYRRYDLNDEEWSAWEKLDLDIQSDHVVPTIYNRKLYLFWLNFVEKPQKVDKLPPAKESDVPTDAPQPPNQLEIQLCWSVCNDGGWTPKRVSKEKLIHPWQRPLHTYHLKTRYKKELNQLWLDIYISQSPEFNSTFFWDAYAAKKAPMTSRFPFDATSRPWHSSSFVFDGSVVDVKMKALAGQYRVVSESDSAHAVLSGTNSLTYVRANFGEAGRAIRPLLGDSDYAPRLAVPDGMHFSTTRLVNDEFPSNDSNVNVLEHGRTRTLLSGGQSPFEIVASEHQIDLDTVDFGLVPFFYQDKEKAFFIKPEWYLRVSGRKSFLNANLQLKETQFSRSAAVEIRPKRLELRAFSAYRYAFRPFYHPFTALFMRELNRSGLEGLLNRKIQVAPESFAPRPTLDFKKSYKPVAGSRLAQGLVQAEEVDFDRKGAYAIYNWEIFFHAPLMIACRLSQNQRFEDAMRWFHFIFDPTNVGEGEVPQRYWVTKPFYETNSDEYRKQRIENLLANIEKNSGQLRAWKNNPFKPHLIARYRPVAYQKTVVMKYIDNLIGWGDQLFRRETIESINEATTLYVLAYELLGRRPIKVPNIQISPKSYKELTAAGTLDAFGNRKEPIPVDILLENYSTGPDDAKRREEGGDPLPMLDVFYFAIPNNDQLLEYWDKVEDRLFKIRHCLNLQGRRIQLPLFEPPIDPALLVKAAAAGVDLDSVMSDADAQVGPYRFRTLAQKATELCGEVRAMGDKLLAALEKSDAEGMALLRSSQEITLQKAVLSLRKQQIKENKSTQESLEQSLRSAEQKKEFYSSREFRNSWETTALALSGTSVVLEAVNSVSSALAGVVTQVPTIIIGTAGFGGTPTATVTIVDGAKLGQSASHGIDVVRTLIGISDRLSSMSATVGGYQRRKDEWDFQKELAQVEIKQVEKQIAAAEIRVAIAEKELENHELQIDHSRALDDYMRQKYTNQDLYNWQVRQLASTYFQSYQLAYDMAKRAEKCFHFELGSEESEQYIQFGHWDSLKKGLLAGEGLAGDIRRMEAAYLANNARDLEITKHVSLRTYFPVQLARLLQEGSSDIVLPEELFDLDYPGHYQRRIKSVAISIPCVVGPYTSVNCTLTLGDNSYRRSDDENDIAPVNALPVRAIATSHGQNDSGVFELTLNDERYLPFEGAGAASSWTISLPKDTNQFDLSTVSDVILHIRYTAKVSSDENFSKAAIKRAQEYLPDHGARLLVLNHEFAGEWQRFLQSKDPQQELSVTLTKEHLPFYARYWKEVLLTKVSLFVLSKPQCDFHFSMQPPDDQPVSTLGEGGVKLEKTFTKKMLGEWLFKFSKLDSDNKKMPLTAADLLNALLVVEFKEGKPESL